MLVYAKLLYNGAKGAVLENFTLKFENCNDFASFFWFWPKKFPGGVPKSQGGCPVIENFPRGGGFVSFVGSKMGEKKATPKVIFVHSKWAYMELF